MSRNRIPKKTWGKKLFRNIILKFDTIESFRNNVDGLSIFGPFSGRGHPIYTADHKYLVNKLVRSRYGYD